MIKEVKQSGVLEKAKRELAEEQEERAIKALKEKLSELDKAKTVVKNKQKEIQDLEQKIKDGNLED